MMDEIRKMSFIIHKELHTQLQIIKLDYGIKIKDFIKSALNYKLLNFSLDELKALDYSKPEVKQVNTKTLNVELNVLTVNKIKKIVCFPNNITFTDFVKKCLNDYIDSEEYKKGK